MHIVLVNSQQKNKNMMFTQLWTSQRFIKMPKLTELASELNDEILTIKKPIALSVIGKV